MLNEQKGNMYPFVTHTWNTVKGECPHACAYCYMKVYKQNPVRFDDSELKTDLGEGNFIFVGSSCDMWAKDISAAWIGKTLEHCIKYPDNTYLFQSKNPERFRMWKFPPKTILITTLETNRHYSLTSKAPSPIERAAHIMKTKHRKAVTIEPVMDFDVREFVDMIRAINPEFVTIGANSKETQLGKLEEPNPEKLKSLIAQLETFTEVRVKSNLRRIMK